MTTTETTPGLFSGFEGHRAPRADEIDTALQSEDLLISIDTNVLLGLYRLSDERSASLRRGLKEHRAKLFLTHQAQVEFWRNRESVLSDRAKAQGEVARQLAKASETVQHGLRTWAKAVSVDLQDLEQALVQVERQFSILARVVNDQHREDTENYPSPGDDEIVRELERLFEGRVGIATATEVHEADVTEGERRHREGQPPGFKEREEDKRTNPEGVAGDYLVWRQSIAEAKKRNCDLLIVTADEKEDWYWKVRGAVVGPRHELSREFYNETGQRLFMLTPLQVDARWRSLAGESAEEGSTGDSPTSDEVDSAVAATPPPAPPLPEGRTEAAVNELLNILSTQAPTQMQVIIEAALGGGRIERSRVYELAGYTPERMLRGFTRPVNRVTRLLQERGDLGLEAKDILVSQYERGVQASAFEVPDEVIPWVVSRES